MPETVENRGVSPYPTHLAWRVLERLFTVADWLCIPALLVRVNRIGKSNTRRLTAQEITLAQTIFGKSIDYQRVEIDEQARIGCRRFHFAYVSFNVINAWGPLQAPHFIHEMVHVWQYQHLGSVYITRALYAQRTLAGYNYGGVDGLREALANGKKFLDFNYEQQGDIVADYFCLQHDYTPRWCTSDRAHLPVFAAIVPFTP